MRSNANDLKFIPKLMNLLHRGQLVGKIGRHVQELTKGKLILPRIYALDPAGKFVFD